MCLEKGTTTFGHSSRFYIDHKIYKAIFPKKSLT